MVRDDVVGGCGLVESKGLFFGFGQGALVVGMTFIRRSLQA